MSALFAWPLFRRALYIKQRNDAIAEHEAREQFRQTIAKLQAMAIEYHVQETLAILDLEEQKAKHDMEREMERDRREFEWYKLRFEDAQRRIAKGAV